MVLAKMKKRGLPTTRGTLTQVRSKLRAEGKEMPYWNKMVILRDFVRLDSKAAIVMKELYGDPRASNKEIKKRLAKRKVKVGIGQIRKIRLKMLQRFPDIDFSPKPKPIRLTKTQERMIPQFQHLTNWALFKHIYPTLNWSSELKKEFSEFVGEKLLLLIKKYEKPRGSIPNYLIKKLRFLVKDFIRKSLEEKMGLKRAEANLLIQIIREKSLGMEDNAKIARKLGCSKKEVSELWEAYQVFLRTQRRLGKREER